MSKLYAKAALGPLTLQNRLVMSPMTRNRATDNIPNALMADYYAQRATAGTIITEGTSPSPNGVLEGPALHGDIVGVGGEEHLVEPRQFRFVDAGAVGFQARLDHGARSVSDERKHLGTRQRSQTLVRKHEIGGGRQIRRGIDESAVKIEYEEHG